MVDKRQLVEEYTGLQTQAIDIVLELVNNAKNRRGEIQRLWQTFQQERSRTFQERMLEQLGEKREKIYERYNRAKGVLNTKGKKLKSLDEGEVRKVMGDEKAVRAELTAMQRDENAEGQAIKKELELTEQETGELEKVERILKSKRNKFLGEEELLEIEHLLREAETALAREIQEQQFQERLDAQENKIAAMMGNLGSQMSRLEAAEKKV